MAKSVSVVTRILVLSCLLLLLFAVQGIKSMYDNSDSEMSSVDENDQYPAMPPWVAEFLESDECGANPDRWFPCEQYQYTEGVPCDTHTCIACCEQHHNTSAADCQIYEDTCECCIDEDDT